MQLGKSHCIWNNKLYLANLRLWLFCRVAFSCITGRHSAFLNTSSSWLNMTFSHLQYPSSNSEYFLNVKKKKLCLSFIVNFSTSQINLITQWYSDVSSSSRTSEKIIFSGLTSFQGLYLVCKYFSHLVDWFFFSFCWWFPLLSRSFLVWCSPIEKNVSCDLSVIVQKITSKIHVKKLFPMGMGGWPWHF